MTSADHVINFDDYIGTEADFYGVSGCNFKLGETIFEVIEDLDGFFQVLINEDAHFGALPIARIVIENAAVIDGGYELIDLHDGHCWLSFGSEVTDTSERSYDREFVFEYTPKAPPIQ